MGNLNSVKRVLDRMNVDAAISSNPQDIINARKIILPGVGHFGKAMSNLKKLHLTDALNEAVLVGKTPVLGICLGMQLMAAKSDEGDAEGLGWFDAEVVKFKTADKMKYKIPHIGWNKIKIKKECSIMSGVGESAEFYFVHSYYLKTHSQSDILNETHYENTFISAVSKNNIFGVQYHPEKSHDAGARILKNFIEL